MNCKFCSKETHNPSYCSTSCAAKCNNKNNPKRKLSKKCRKCNCYITKSRTYCKDCWSGKQKSFVVHEISINRQRCLNCNIVSTSENSYIARKRYSSYCKICSKSLLKQTKTNLKLRCIKYKGGKCEKCGYCKNSSALAFHHLDPSAKDFNIGDMYSTKFDVKLKQELDKCMLLCFNCHQEIHHPESVI